MLISTVGVVTNNSSSSRHQWVLQIKSKRKAIPVAPIASSPAVHDGGRHVIGSSSTVASSEYKLKAIVLKAPHGDLLTCMEMAKACELLFTFVGSFSEQSL
ncbi:unnamed protein product [Arabidopsis arenosa]|uniref:Uncharacterized protein n=1 Tax=Arabidopsis arenosa TaxID=38785 RepID=A0A8S2AXS1_ARAAE|nr:unnamed protein product [Arabidopsis arenosa]